MKCLQCSARDAACNRLPSYESGSVADDLGTALPNNVRVDIYDAPTVKGFQISYTDSNSVQNSNRIWS